MIRSQIEDELKLQYKTKFDQMNVQHKIKLNEIKSYCDSKIKLNTDQSKNTILKLTQDNASLTDTVNKLEEHLADTLFELNQHKNSNFGNFFFNKCT